MNNFYSCMCFASSLRVPGLKRYSEGITIHFENDLYVKEVNQEFKDEEFEIELDSEVYLENRASLHKGTKCDTVLKV